MLQALVQREQERHLVWLLLVLRPLQEPLVRQAQPQRKDLDRHMREWPQAVL